MICHMYVAYIFYMFALKEGKHMEIPLVTQRPTNGYSESKETSSFKNQMRHARVWILDTYGTVNTRIFLTIPYAILVEYRYLAEWDSTYHFLKQEQSPYSSLYVTIYIYIYM